MHVAAALSNWALTTVHADVLIVHVAVRVVQATLVAVGAVAVWWIVVHGSVV